MKKLPTSHKFWENAKFPIPVAHRGGDAAGIEKENSLKAFQAAYNLGYRWFETDVVATKDGILLAMHGRGLQRRPNKDLPNRLKIQRMRYKDILKTIYVGGEPVLTLEELLNTFQDTRVFIDPKTLKTAPILADFLTNRPQDLHRVCIGSFRSSNTNLVYRRIKELTSQEITTGAIGAFRGSLLILSSYAPLLSFFVKAYIYRTNTSTFYLPYKWTKGSRGRKIIKCAHGLGLRVVCYTANTKKDIKNSIDSGVDAVMSDNIKLLQKITQNDPN